MLLLRKLQNTPFGQYAFVFITDDGRAIKVFRRRPLDQDNHARDVFKSEVDAYRIACNTDELKGLVSHYIGEVQCSCIRIEDAHGMDISEEFMLDCVYEMRRLCGASIGFEALPDMPRERLRAQFIGAGIHHIKDSTVFLNGDGTIRSVIDFALEEYVLEHPNF
jgi:hypothetical protein